MFYEVRVLDSNNKLKKIINGRQLSRKYWDKFESNFNISSSKPKNVKKKSVTKSNQLKNIKRMGQKSLGSRLHPDHRKESSLFLINGASIILFLLISKEMKHRLLPLNMAKQQGNGSQEYPPLLLLIEKGTFASVMQVQDLNQFSTGIWNPIFKH